jgi:alpha 1,2-mannosyltransferase
MRSKLRGRRATILAVLICVLFYLYASDRLSFEVTTRIPPVLPSDESLQYGRLTLDPIRPGLVQEIKSLWDDWSQSFQLYRPSPDHIRLRREAPTVKVPVGDKSPRRPPTNRIINSDDEIDSMRISHGLLLDNLAMDMPNTDMFNGTGVVVMGGGEYFGPAIIGLLKLRLTGSTLPVEIFVADAKEYEPALCEDYLPKYGARCQIIADYFQSETSQEFKVTHYQLKALAIFFSSFSEVLYLDSDSIPLVDPAGFFTSEPYTSSGLVIWPDFWISTESPLFYDIAGFPNFPSDLPRSSSEAGQLMIDKKTHIKTLLLAIYYNIYGPSHFYPLLSQGVLGQGDKETFMAAAIVLKDPYYRVKTDVKSVGRHTGREWKGSGMVQHNPVHDFRYTEMNEEMSGAGLDATIRPAFLHANTPKMNAGHLVDEGDLFGANKRKRLRLWGSWQNQIKQFGIDIEKEIWGLLVKSGCELEDVITEWKSRNQMCARLEAHWNAIF